MTFSFNFFLGAGDGTHGPRRAQQELYSWAVPAAQAFSLKVSVHSYRLPARSQGHIQALGPQGLTEERGVSVLLQFMFRQRHFVVLLINSLSVELFLGYLKESFF